VSKGAFYHHFASKQAAFVVLLERWLAIVEGQLVALKGDADEVPAGLLRMADVAQRVFENNAGQLPIILEFWSRACRDPEIRQAAIAPYRQFRELFAEMIAEGTAQGSLAPVDAEAAAQTLVSLAVGVMLQGMLDPDGADWGRVARQGIEILVKGIEAHE
jgi:AcrR family transcriptional regulator